jgi:hypothetical protein
MRKIWAKKCRGGFGALFLSTALGHEWHDPRHDPRQLKIDLLLPPPPPPWRRRAAAASLVRSSSRIEELYVTVSIKAVISYSE